MSSEQTIRSSIEGVYRSGSGERTPEPARIGEGVGSDLWGPARVICGGCGRGVILTTEGCQCRGSDELGVRLGTPSIPTHSYCSWCDWHCGVTLVYLVDIDPDWTMNDDGELVYQPAMHGPPPPGAAPAGEASDDE